MGYFTNYSHTTMTVTNYGVNMVGIHSVVVTKFTSILFIID